MIYSFQVTVVRSYFKILTEFSFLLCASYNTTVWIRYYMKIDYIAYANFCTDLGHFHLFMKMYGKIRYNFIFEQT